MSLPSLNKPQRDQIDSILLQDRERIRQKLKEGHFQSDVSHLKDLKKDLIQSEQPIDQLPSTLNEILSLTYPELKIPFDLQKFLNSRKASKKVEYGRFLISGRNSDFSSNFLPSFPSSRQETLNLKNWLDRTEARFVPILKELVDNQGVGNKQVAVKAWKAIYVFIFKEIVKQVASHCAERGELLVKCFQEIDKLADLAAKVFRDEIKSVEKDHDKKVQEFTQPLINEIAFLQGKVQRLEREKEKWTHNKAEMIVKSKEIINYLEVLRKFEDQVKHIKGKSRYFDSYISFFNSMAIEELNEFSTTISDKFKEEISTSAKILHKTRQKLQEQLSQLKSVEDEIVDKEVKLSSLVFELELKENLSKPRIKRSEKIPSMSENTLKKELMSITKPYQEDEKTLCDRFFTKLVVKSKERLINNSKVPAEHVFKSLTVIYNRCSVQLNINQTPEFQSLQFLLYKQFIKTSNRKKSEKNLKDFLSGCLKISENRRVSVFLRLLNFGGWIEKEDYSHKSFLLYLSMFLYLQNSNIGLIVYKDHGNAVQYFPFSRILACLKEIQPIFNTEVFESILDFIEKNKIIDPKQVNPAGLIEVELVLERVLDEHEKMFKEIIENLTQIFLPFEKIDRDCLRNVMGELLDPKREVMQIVEAECQVKDEFELDDVIDLACKVGAATHFLIERFLIDFISLNDEETRAVVKAHLSLKSDPLSQKVLQSLDQMNKRACAFWHHMLKSLP